MLEEIIKSIILVIIIVIWGALPSRIFRTFLFRYIDKMPLKKSIDEGLLIGYSLAMIGTSTYFNIQIGFQLITAEVIVGSIVSGMVFLGPIIFLLTIYRYFMSNLPLKDSIRNGLITGLIAGIVIIVMCPILMKSFDFFIDLI